MLAVTVRLKSSPELPSSRPPADSPRSISVNHSNQSMYPSLLTVLLSIMLISYDRVHTMADVNISMPVNSSQKQLEQHPSLYFADGDLVIVACTDPAAANSIVFRVHGAILGLFSPVFAGMLSLPAPSVSGRELYDGVPLVHLSDDAKDMADFLDALYNPGCVSTVFILSSG